MTFESGLLEFKAYFARFTPILAAVVTPYIIGLIKTKKPEWKDKYRERWPYVAAAIGIGLNLCGLAISPDIIFADTTGSLARVDPLSSIAASAAVGYISGMGASKQRDLRRGRKVCSPKPKTSRPKKKLVSKEK